MVPHQRSYHDWLQSELQLLQVDGVVLFLDPQRECQCVVAHPRRSLILSHWLLHPPVFVATQSTQLAARCQMDSPSPSRQTGQRGPPMFDSDRRVNPGRAKK